MKRVIFGLIILLSMIGYVFAAKLIDPTKPPGANIQLPQISSQPQAKGLQLWMIYRSRRVKRALINDTFVEAGDTLAGYKVIKIEKGGVILQNIASHDLKHLSLAPQLLMKAHRR